jgi:signal transduction histidine kinase
LKPRLIVMLVLIVALPLALVAWLGARMSRNERQMVQLRVEELLVSRLRDVDADIQDVLARQSRVLLQLQGLADRSPGELRDLGSSLPEVSHLFVLDQLGALVYPVPAAPLTDNERAFLERTRDIWLDRQLPPRGEEGQAPVQQQMAQQASAPRPTAQMASPKPGSKSGYRAAASQGAAVSADSGWYAWFWRNGVNLLYWWRESGGRIAGAELNRGRMLSEIINALPVTDPRNPTLAEGRIVLRGAQGESLYQWGLYEPGENEAPRASLMLSPPLSSWRLDHYASARMAAPDMGRSVYFNVFSAAAALLLAVVALAAYFYRENTRELREAGQRISFVNQVSHELKTPLTNIRMYAEMLEGELDDAEPRIRKRLGVITSESQRLSRLIGNVLTFSRKQRSALRLRRSPGVVDAVLRNTLEHCTAPLRAKGMEVIFEANAPHMAEFDADAVEQVAGNLLSNVEKYASTGTFVRVVSRQDGDWIAVSVADDGPGIPLRERRRVFEPFYRVSNRLTDGVAGTGIGLAIARDLARLHGGDLVLDDSPAGACFTFSFHAPRAYPEETP